MNKKLLAWLTTFVAIGLAGTAAYYSIIGLSKLFAGVAIPVIFMASFLEMSKLTIATFLHSYWTKISKLFKRFFITSLVILSLITSVGIYGLLSQGYQQTANKTANVDSKVILLETKRNSYREQLNVYNGEKSSITTSVNELRKGLSNNIIQYKDAKTGQYVSTTSSATRKALENQLEQAVDRQSKVDTRIDSLNTKIFDLESEIVEIKTSGDLVAELGPLKYLQELTGVPMNKIINWLILVIILVFDPLAIGLIVAANFAFDQIRKQYKVNIYGEKTPLNTESTPKQPEKDEVVFYDNLENTEDNRIFNVSPDNEVEKEIIKKLPHFPFLSTWGKNKVISEYGEEQRKKS